jgi:hypothetical protein
MHATQRTALFIALLLAAFTPLSGCTLFPQQKTPTIQNTTSAEQLTRIFWRDVQEQKWAAVNSLIAPNLIFLRDDGKHLDRDQTIAYLKTLELSGVQILNVQLKGNNADMTVTYTIQFGYKNRGLIRQLSSVAVWQQINADELKAMSKKDRKAAPTYLLTTLALTPPGDATSTPTQ